MKKSNFVLGMIAAAGLSVGLTSCNCAPKAHLNNDLDSVAYAFGVIQGAQFAAVADSSTLVPDEQLNLDEFLAGFLTAVKRDSSSLKMSAEDADAYLRGYFDDLRRKAMEKQQQEAEARKESDKAFLDENGAKEGVVTTESGLQYQVLSEGKGAAPEAGDRVVVNYTGTFTDGTVFDEGDSAAFNVSGVVPGFREALMLMTPGSEYQVWFPSNLGYGDRGAQGGQIPGGAALGFKIKLREVIPAPKPKK